ncbi:unnamed protein product [Rhodiola kirilowii]
MGLVSMFHFRRGGSNQKLRQDKGFGNKVLCGDGFSPDRSVKKLEYQLVKDACESTQPMLRAGKQSGEKLMHEDLVIEDNRKQNSNDAENQDCNLERRSHKRSSTSYEQKRKHLSVSSAMEFEDVVNDADINNLVREIFIRIQQKRAGGVEHGQNYYLCPLPGKSHGKFVKQLIDATKVVLREKLINGVQLGRDGKILYSREFMDATETLISHKDLFFKLLEDPNSELTSRINKLLSAELGKSSCKDIIFSRRRVRSQGLVLQSDDESSESPRSNAILDSGSIVLSTYNAANSSESKLKTKSAFSFIEIKRMLKRAMGKNREDASTKNEMASKVSRGNQVSRSPSRSPNPHLEDEIHPKRMSHAISDNGIMERSDMTSELEMFSPSMNDMSGSYVEPNKHSSQMLTDGDSHEKFSKRQDLELARKCFSTPDGASACSPTFSSTTQSSCISLTTHVRSSSPRKPHSSNEDLSAQLSVGLSIELDDTFSTNCESQYPSPIISDHEVFDEGESQCYVEMSSSADVKDQLLQIEEITSQTNESAEKVRSSATMEDEGEIGEVCKAVSNDCDEQDGNEEDGEAPKQIISADSYLDSDTTEESDNVTSRMDRSSPVSVLEPVCLEDEISPLSTKTIRAGEGELPVTPLQIHFEEVGLSESDLEKSTFDKKSCNDNESSQKFIKEILTASDFSWDTMYIRSLSSDQLLDVSLYDTEVDIHSDQPSNEYKLLLDCLNEVLMDSCARYFGSSPCMPLSKPNIRPIPDTENAIREIWERVEWHLRPSSSPRGFEQIVDKDLAKDGRWMDLRFDVDTIGTEIENLILQELIEDTILSCLSDVDDVIAISAESNADSTSLN